MVTTMIAAMAGQVLAGTVGVAAGLGSHGWQGFYEAVMGTGLFASLWLLAAWLFRTAARAEAAA